MVPINLAQDFRTLDQWCVSEQGIDPWDLMMRASQNVADAVLLEISKLAGVSRVLVAAGPGNNGGDGLCVARILRTQRPDIHIAVLDVASDGSTSALRARARIELPNDIDIVQHDLFAHLGEYHVVIDAIMGNGGSEVLRDPIPEVLRSLAGHTAFRIALDVPTGLNCSTGAAHPDVFRADITVTISAEKLGFWLDQGPATTGRVIVVPLGVDGAEDHLPRDVVRLGYDDVAQIIPVRQRRYSKFDAGTVVIIGGTCAMPGAPSLAAHAALRSGAGLVHLASPRIHPVTPREIIVHELPHDDQGAISSEAYVQLRALVQRASVVAVGPGIGTCEPTLRMLLRLVEEIPESTPVVIDADGLRIVPMLSVLRSNMILTPHRGEYARMLNIDHRMMGVDPISLVRSWGSQHPAVLHLKDTPSATHQHHRTVLTVNGSPRMATAGSGDVLTGIVAGIIAQGADPFLGTALAAFVHAEAGRLSSGSDDRPIVASDMIRRLPALLAHSPSG